MKYKAFTIETKSIDESGSFEAYASTFGDKDRHGDIIVKGAFTNSIKKFEETAEMPVLLWAHKQEEPIGIFDKINEDDKGLFVSGRLLVSEVQKAKEVYSLIKNKAIKGLSIGFRNAVEKFDRVKNANLISDLDLLEISMVSIPANPFSNIINVKSINTIRDFENMLVEVGFSKKQAKAICSQGYKGIYPENNDNEIKELADILKKNIEILSK